MSQNNANNNTSLDDEDLSLSTLDTMTSKASLMRHDEDEEGVGKGTLIMDRLQPPPSQQQQQPRGAGGTNVPTASISAKNPSHNVMLGSLITTTTQQPNYGATTTTTSTTDPPQQQQYRMPHQHDYDYHHPDPAAAAAYSHHHHHDPYGPSSPPRRGCCGGCGLLQSMAACWHSEPVWRSFCYGAMDGMLTGAGLLAALAGMGWIDLHSNSDNANNGSYSSLQQQQQCQIALGVLLLSAAACAADAVAVALGHVWTTHWHTQGAVHERAAAQRHFLAQPPAESKAQLVDLLLARGVLKIDAMSLADTLEGYPDLLVSALIGESLTVGVSGGGGGGGSAAASHQYHHHHHHAPTTSLVHDMGGGGGDSGGDLHHRLMRNTIPSYSAYHHHDSLEVGGSGADMDPDRTLVREAVREATLESCSMWLGFSLFALVPSGLVLLRWVLADANSGSSGSSPDDDQVVVVRNSSPFVQPTTLLVFGACLVMACLGAWKSKFVEHAPPPLPPSEHENKDTPTSEPQAQHSASSASSTTTSHAILFAVQAVAVLLVCLGTGYGLGWALSQALDERFAIVALEQP